MCKREPLEGVCGGNRNKPVYEAPMAFLAPFLKGKGIQM